MLRIHQHTAVLLIGGYTQTNVIHDIEHREQQITVLLVALAPGSVARFAKPTLHANDTEIHQPNLTLSVLGSLILNLRLSSRRPKVSVSDT